MLENEHYQEHNYTLKKVPNSTTKTVQTAQQKQRAVFILFFYIFLKKKAKNSCILRKKGVLLEGIFSEKNLKILLM